MLADVEKEVQGGVEGKVEIILEALHGAGLLLKLIES